MKEIIAAIIIAALAAAHASAASRHPRAPQRFDFEQRNGDPYDSRSQGRQPYVNPDRQPYITQFDRPAS
jgi:hypothetical protein